MSHNDSVLSQRNFWVRDAKNSQAELDFVIQTEQQLILVEIKSGRNSKIKSMHLFMEASRNNFAIRFWNNPMQKDEVGKKYTLLSLPFYYAEIIDNILKNNDINKAQTTIVKRSVRPQKPCAKWQVCRPLESL